MPAFLTPLVLRILAAAALFAAGFAWGFNTNGDRWEAKWEKEQRRLTEAALESERRARARETELLSVVDKHRRLADDALENVREQGRLLAALRVDVGRVRDGLASYASRGGSEDSVAACQSRAGRLAALLAEGSGLLEEGRAALAECAVAADRRSVKLRACLEAWPK